MVKLLAKDIVIYNRLVALLSDLFLACKSLSMASWTRKWEMKALYLARPIARMMNLGLGHVKAF